MKKKQDLVQDYQIRNVYNDEAFITMDGDNLEFEDSYTFNPRILSSIEFGSVLETLSINQSVPVNISRLVNDTQNYESRLLEHEINLDDEQEYSPDPLKTIFGYISYPLVLLLNYTIPMMSLSDFDQTIKPSFTRLMKLLCSLSCAQFIIIYSFAENASWGTKLCRRSDFQPGHSKCRLSTDGTRSMLWRPVIELTSRDRSQREDRWRGRRQHETQLVFDLSLDSH
ncbi:hypothetical protein KL909_004974 [Ogataea angusta]|nr:hypothetical protein KL909_004974 [Ogataea angusta]